MHFKNSLRIARNGVATSQGVANSQWRVRLSKDNYPAMCYL